MCVTVLGTKVVIGDSPYSGTLFRGQGSLKQDGTVFEIAKVDFCRKLVVRNVAWL